MAGPMGLTAARLTQGMPGASFPAAGGRGWPYSHRGQVFPTAGPVVVPGAGPMDLAAAAFSGLEHRCCRCQAASSTGIPTASGRPGPLGRGPKLAPDPAPLIYPGRSGMGHGRRMALGRKMRSAGAVDLYGTGCLGVGFGCLLRDPAPSSETLEGQESVARHRDPPPSGRRQPRRL